MMVTLSTLVTFLGFWCCYQTSQRAELKAATGVVQWLRQHRVKTQRIGIAGMVAGLVLSMVTFGVGSGIFAYLMILTVVSSLVIILAPLGLMTRRNIALALVICSILEIAL
ncbi:hypothetical protein [Fulvivirga kasyanovii]|uniref:DUF3325 domain-containing protein n=1 Tax=Fulvivirga kasyanovii TaxID=396812 RepID=A0ABW9RWJ8_9BACT|nr:hypothetical protein [Fulvivirga kasyanovii]MTI27380.1 hypothetical protein [Fulvivirga kasyanovii]